jgi:hypothetical protein
LLFAPYSSNDAWRMQNKDDSQARVVLDSNGYLNFGPGDAATDTRLYRSAENALRVADGDDLLIEGAYDGGRLRLGSYYLWVDESGNLRIKSSEPSTHDDGSKVGGQ